MRPRSMLAVTISLGLALLTALALPASAGAQDEPGIELMPVELQVYDVASVVPAKWSDIGLGQFARGTPPEDWTLVAIQSAAGRAADVLPLLGRQLALPSDPEPTGRHAGDAFEWTLYAFETALPAPVAGELALAEDVERDTTYLVLLLASPDEFPGLRSAVFLPALEAYRLLGPEPTPDPAEIAYAVEEVAFPGAAEGVELSGTLTLPPGPGPHPVVVMMSGSGPNDRDQSLEPVSTLRPFAVLADALTTAGVGVLRYDDRGVGASTGDHAAATIEDFAADVSAAIDYLESRGDVDPARVGLFGHSEGGLYAAMLGAHDPRVAWIGLMAPAVLDGISLIVEQNVAVSRSVGASKEEAEMAGAFAAQIMPLVLAGEFDEAERLGRDFFAQAWDRLTAAEQAAYGDVDTFVAQGFEVQMPIYQSDWYRSFLGYDPAPDWERVTVPVLAVFGGRDAQVVAASNEAALRRALAAGGNEDVTTVFIPAANHLFQEAETGAPTEYARLAPEFIDGFVEEVVTWMAERAGVSEPA